MDLARLIKKGQDLLRGKAPVEETEARPERRPAAVAIERRSGRRVPLPLAVRIKMGASDPLEVQVKDVNPRGLAIVPSAGIEVGETLSVGFDGYPDVSPGFALRGIVRRIIPASVPGEPSGMGIEIDREASSADAQHNYRKLVLHYVRHRPLLSAAQGYFEGRCTSCDRVGRVDRRRPTCSRCGSEVVPYQEGEFA